ncbi:hypothetical protein PYCC9005_001155 [Savitreella phatthalungensis]
MSNNQTESDDVHVTIFFIPGNPGLAAYYTPFLDALTRLLTEAHTNDRRSPKLNLRISPKPTIITCDHLGLTHTPPSPYAIPTRPGPLSSGVWGRWFGFGDVDLWSQCGDKLGVWEDVVVAGTPSHSRRIVIGHSVGAFMALPLAISPTTQPLAIYHLTPTLTHIANAPAATNLVARTAIALAAPLIPLVTAVSGVVGAIAACGGRRWVGRCVRGWVGGGHSDEAVAVTVDGLVCRPRNVWGALKLGVSEMVEITSVEKVDAFVRAVSGGGKGRLWEEVLAKSRFYYAVGTHGVSNYEDDIGSNTSSVTLTSPSDEMHATPRTREKHDARATALAAARRLASEGMHRGKPAVVAEDHWVSSDARREICGLVDRAVGGGVGSAGAAALLKRTDRVVECREVSHAWCTSAVESERVARQVVSWLFKDIDT